MPYFKWSGINLSGKTTNGISRALSNEELEQKLFDHEIALLSAVYHNRQSRFRPIFGNHKIYFFEQLAMLLDSGVFLRDALQLVAHNCNHPVFKEIIEDIHNAVDQGTPLDEIMERFNGLFEPMSLTLIHVGHQTGHLASVLLLYAQHLKARDAFYKKVRSAATMPLITFLFFIVIAALVIIFMVPAFSTLFDSLQQSPAMSTQWLLAFARWLNSTNLIFLLIGCLIVLLGIRFALQKQYIQKKAMRILWYVPLMGKMHHDLFLMYFFKSCNLMLAQGVSVIQAVQTLQKSTGNEYYRSQLGHVEEYLNQGILLHKALEKAYIQVSSETRSLIALGEESGNLTVMFEKVADAYQKNLDRYVHIISSVAQPILMIVLGMLILGLIVSVYMPLFNISLVMQ